MNDNKMSEIIESSVASLKSVMDADTIIGEAIKAENGTTIIPVSKLSVGFVSGGLDYAGKAAEKKNNFGGGGGTGLSLTPVCFLVIHSDGKVEMLSVKDTVRNNPDPVSDIVGLIEKAPDIAEKLKAVFSKKTDEE